MDPSIKAVQESLEKTARSLLKYLDANELSHADNKKLAKFIFGCMLQKSTIQSRVEQRGSGELTKVLNFIGKASQAVLKIDKQRNKEEGS